MSEGLRPIARTTLERLFQIVKYDARLEKKYPKEPHKWYKRKAQASKELGLSRPTIDKWLDRYPHGLPALRPAKLAEPKYVEDFNATEAWQRLKDYKYAGLIKPTVLTAWKLLGKREPIEWTEQDIRDLRKPTVTRKGVTQDNPLYLPLTKDIAPEHAVNLRRAFRELSLYALEKPLEGVPKRPHGTRLTWYLENDEVRRLIEGADSLESLLYIVLELQCGARPSSMIITRVNDINWKEGYIHYYEPKKRQYIPRFFIPETMHLLQRYVSEKGLKLTDRLFPFTVEQITDKIKDIGFKQNIQKLQVIGAGAYVLRHTFATQAAEHEVPLETVMQQGGWKDASTLLNHYMFLKPTKVRRDLFGVTEEKPIPFGSWVKIFAPVWERKYEELRQKAKP